MSKSRREALQAGFDAVEAGSDPVEAIEALGDVGADDAPQDDPAPARDAAPAPDGERIARPASGQVATPAADGDKFAEAPKNWKPEFREKYKTLPPDIKAYLYQREDEQAKGVEPILQKAKRADAIDQIFEPATMEAMMPAMIPNPNESPTSHNRRKTTIPAPKPSPIDMAAIFPYSFTCVGCHGFCGFACWIASTTARVEISGGGMSFAASAEAPGLSTWTSRCRPTLS